MPATLVWPTVSLYHTCLLRVADKDGNAISGATVTLKDSGGATEKTTSTNTDGYFLDETIAITAATTTTITDSSKSWTVDTLRGKEIIITSGVNARSSVRDQEQYRDPINPDGRPGNGVFGWGSGGFAVLRLAVRHQP